MDKATLKKRVRSSISYFKHTLFPILVYGAGVGLVTGALIWAYTLAVEFVCEKSREVYLFVQSNPLFSPLLFIGLLLLATLSWLNIRRTPEVSGSGVPFSEGVMRGLLPMKWYKVLPSMIFGSLLSFIGGLPLGSEGPSVLIGACVGNAVNDVGRKSNLTRYAWRRQNVTGGASAGFAVAFNAPLAGIVFALEEGHKRFSPMILLPAAASVITATLTANLMTKLTGHGLDTAVFNQFSGIANPNLSQVGYLMLLGLAMGLLSVLFSLALNFANNTMRKLKIHPLLKIAAVFVLSGVVGIFMIDAIGGGAGVIAGVAEGKYTLNVLIALLAVKIALVILCSSSGVTGGLFIPILAIGALYGGVMANLFGKIGLDEQYYGTIVLISMCAFLGGVMRSPITAIVLVVEMTHQLTSALWAPCLVIVLSYFITELFNVEPIYDNSLGALLKKRYEGKRKKLVECEMEIEPGSFAVNRSVRDILWPANTLVIKVKKIDAEGNILYSMDEDGERKIHVGDKFIFQSETSDFTETYRQLCYIVKSPGFDDTFIPPEEE